MKSQNSKVSYSRLVKSKCLSFALVALLVGLLCFYLITVVFAAPGDLDTTFAGTGKTLIGFGFSNDRGSALAMQTDGKIVVAGTTNNKFGVMRYNPDGSLDNSFNGN